MKQALLALGLAAFSLLLSCESTPTSGSGDGCATCEANDAVKTAVPAAKTPPCASCMKHEMLADCPKCEEQGKPCCEVCAAKMKCPGCESAGEECASCKIANADCSTCAVKEYTWTTMSCEACEGGEAMCVTCTELKTNLDAVACEDCKG